MAVPKMGGRSGFEPVAKEQYGRPSRPGGVLAAAWSVLALFAATSCLPASAQAPTNDLFEGRVVLEGLTNQVEATNTLATNEVGEPAHRGSPAVRSLWWVKRSSKDGYAVIDTSGSPTRTRVDVYDEHKRFTNLQHAASLNLSGLSNRPDRYEFNIRNTLDASFAVDARDGDSGAIRVDVTVYTTPEILVQPMETNLIAGQSFTNTLVALGKLPMTYHWQMRPDTPNGVFTNRQVSEDRDFALGDKGLVSVLDDGWYRVIVTNSYGAVTSKVVRLPVYTCARPDPPQPSEIVTNVGKTATFAASALGTPPYRFQWQFKPENLHLFNDIPGATESNLMLTNLSTDEAGDYRFLVSNDACPDKTNISERATLLVTTNNALVLDPALPQSLLRITNENASFDVRVIEGYQPIYYQWWFQPDAGTARSLLPEIAPNLAKSGVRLSDAGRY